MSLFVYKNLRKEEEKTGFVFSPYYQGQNILQQNRTQKPSSLTGKGRYVKTNVTFSTLRIFPKYCSLKNPLTLFTERFVTYAKPHDKAVPNCTEKLTPAPFSAVSWSYL